MTRRTSRTGATVAAVVAAVMAALALLNSTAVTTAGSAETATSPVSQASPASPTVSDDGSGTTSAPPAFVDGEDARLAAEELIGAYLESELGATVADVACSVPPTGEVGDRFACYALRADDLVVALRASVAPGRLIELELIVDQGTTTTTTSTSSTTVPALDVATTEGG